MTTTQYVYLLFKDTSDFDPASEVLGVYGSLTAAKTALRKTTAPDAKITQNSTSLWSAPRTRKYEAHWIERKRVQR